MMTGLWAAAALWLLAAVLLRWRGGPASAPVRLVLALAGIPLLGLLTWQAGPWPGTLGLLLGVLLLPRPAVSGPHPAE
jgi:hypothetical protein